VASGPLAVSIIDLDDGRELSRVEAHEAELHALGASADGRRGLTGDLRGVVVAWDLTTVPPRATRLGAHAWKVRQAALSPDGRLGVTTSVDGTARVWDLVAGREAQRIDLDQRGDFPIAAAFLPTGRGFLLGTSSGLVLIFDVEPRE
jgi:WD40 repeat protein